MEKGYNVFAYNDDLRIATDQQLECEIIRRRHIGWHIQDLKMGRPTEGKIVSGYLLKSGISYGISKREMNRILEAQGTVDTGVDF